MKRKTSIVLITLIITTGSPVVARAGVTGVDVSGALYTGPGVLDTNAREWAYAPNTGNWFWLDGRKVTMQYGDFRSGGINADIDLFDNYKHNVNGTVTFDVIMTNLDVSITYNLVIYGAQSYGGGRGGWFDPVEPDLPDRSTTGDQQSTFEEGVNYLLYEDVRPDNNLGDARIRFQVGNGPEDIGIFNGFELKSPDRQYAVVVNVDVPGERVEYTGPGVLNDPGTNWNNVFAAGGTNLVDSLGNATPVDVTFSGLNPASHGAIGTAVNPLTTDYFFDEDDDLALTISGLTPGRTYDLALFGCQDGFGGRGSTFTIAGHGGKTTTADFSGLNPDGFLEGKTHVLFFDVVVDGSGAIVVNITPEGANGISFINGFQIGHVIKPEGTQGTFMLIR